MLGFPPEDLCSHFDLPQHEWPGLAQRIDELLRGQRSLLNTTLSHAGQALAQRYAAQLIAMRPSAASLTPAAAAKADAGEVDRYQEVDLDSLELVRPRSVGVEHAALSAMRQSGLEDKLGELGMNRPQIAAAVGNIFARMAHPGSELATHAWLQQRSGLGELIGFDFEAMDLQRLYLQDQIGALDGVRLGKRLGALRSVTVAATLRTLQAMLAP